jgi:rhamnulose-1-phosphate aldolase/alcohol dehydrogenase
MSTSTDFRHVSHGWDPAVSASMEGDEVALLVYRSNLLGADLRLTNYGGGNTSCKAIADDPLSGKPTEVMWVKGSGGDLGSMKRDGLASLRLDRLLGLEKVYRGPEHEDEMVPLFNHCLFDPQSKAPSIDTPLHAFLPFRHIDHLHPDAVIAIAASKDGKAITREIFGDAIGWVDWRRPGFELGLNLRRCLQQNPDIRGIVLGSHGLFTWGDTSHACYLNTLEVIEKCSEHIEGAVSKKGKLFGGTVIQALPAEKRRSQAAQIAPVLRGLCSSHHRMVGRFTDDERVLSYIGSADFPRLAPMGTSCPDHFLRTKIAPLTIGLEPEADLSDIESVTRRLAASFEDYRNAYTRYYEGNRRPDSPAIRDPNPVVLLWPGVGMFTFARDRQTARFAGEYYVNAIQVMRGAEALSTYVALPEKEAFDIEYWLLEEAKLQRMPKPKPMNGRVALVTGSGGGIGRAVARKFAEEGACVVLNDIDTDRLGATLEDFGREFGADRVIAVRMDVTDAASIKACCREATLAFGGIDLLVNNAGISLAKAFEDHSESDWDRVFDILVKGQFLVSKSVVKIMKKQGLGGDIVNIVSKNALFAGPQNAGYGSAKAAQLHMTRLMAAELGSYRIRVNAVNPDAVIADSNIWAGGWAEGRAKAYGITVEELPSFYAKRTLLNESILPQDIANACYAFACGLLDKSTGNTLNVDGGVAAAFTR